MVTGDKIFITSPLMPSKEDLFDKIEKLYQTKRLTNMGELHKELEEKLTLELGVKHLSLFNNGTISLVTAIKALNLPTGSEIITTPFTFAATPHSIVWNGLQPVFCDIEAETMTIDADKIEDLITPNTKAILGVHVYGFPCNVNKIQQIADKYELKVIYDAAHAFSTKIDGKDIGNFSDISSFSFHATKLFNTIEGGALTYNDEKLVHKIYNLRNFGIRGEEVVEEVGINGKMNEVQALWGLENLKLYRNEQKKRAKIKEFYDNELSKVEGIRLPQMPTNTTNSYQYYPIVIENDYPLNRNEIYDKFKEFNIMTRKYFYPACHDYECYKNDTMAKRTELPIVDDIKNKILCLPYYGSLPEEKQLIITNKLKTYFGK